MCVCVCVRVYVSAYGRLVRNRGRKKKEGNRWVFLCDRWPFVGATRLSKEYHQKSDRCLLPFSYLVWFFFSSSFLPGLAKAETLTDCVRNERNCFQSVSVCTPFLLGICDYVDKHAFEVSSQLQLNFSLVCRQPL